MALLLWATAAGASPKVWVPPTSPSLPPDTTWCKRCPAVSHTQKQSDDKRACVCDKRGRGIGYISTHELNNVHSHDGRDWRSPPPDKDFVTNEMDEIRMRGRLGACGPATAGQEPYPNHWLCSRGRLNRLLFGFEYAVFTTGFSDARGRLVHEATYSGNTLSRWLDRDFDSKDRIIVEREYRLDQKTRAPKLIKTFRYTYDAKGRRLSRSASYGGKRVILCTFAKPCEAPFWRCKCKSK